MKSLVGVELGSYSFNASAGTITFGGFPQNYLVGIQQVLLITNVTSNIIIYNFASAPLGGTMNNNVLTLDYNTSSMSNSDSLQIYIDSEVVNDSLETLLRRMNKLLESNAIVDVTGRQRVTIDGLGTAGTVTTTLPVTATVAAGQGPLGGANTNYQGTTNPPYTLASQNVQYIGEGPVDQRWRVMEDARQSYVMAIRSNLTWA
jgi:hypothetical protein